MYSTHDRIHLICCQYLLIGEVQNHIFLPLMGVIMPLMITHLNLPFMPRLFTTEEHLFGMFSFFMGVVLIINACRDFRELSKLPVEKIIIIVLPFLVSFFFLFLVVEYFGRSWDYKNYERAFIAIVQNQNPYDVEYYLYPPFFAQAMASLYFLGERYLSFMKVDLWLLVSYIHQCSMFFLANIAYQLSRKLASCFKFSELAGTILVSGLFVFNYPLIRTLHLNQINLYTLIAVLVSLLMLSNRPLISGIAIALGGLIKIYPLVLTVPLFLAKRWRAVFGVALGLSIIILFQTHFGKEVLLWKQFIHFYFSFPFERESSLWFRNSSLLSFIRGLVQLAHLPENLTLILFILSVFGVVGWLFVRFYSRRMYFIENGISDSPYLGIGHLIDFSVLMLLVTPSAWDHHYLIAVPLALWTIALSWKENLLWVITGLASVFILPPFDVFPFSYVRTLGIFILLIFASPQKTPTIQ